MPNHRKAPPLPGAENPRSLLIREDELAECPCCGAVWRGDRPWSQTVVSPAQLAAEMGQTPQNITHRIRTGTIAAYPAAGTGGRHTYLIPIVEAARVKQESGIGGEEEVLHG